VTNYKPRSMFSPFHFVNCCAQKTKQKTKQNDNSLNSEFSMTPMLHFTCVFISHLYTFMFLAVWRRPTAHEECQCWSKTTCQ